MKGTVNIKNLSDGYCSMFQNKYLQFNFNPEETEDMGTKFKAVL
jgi:hypothetical protein